MIDFSSSSTASPGKLDRNQTLFSSTGPRPLPVGVHEFQLHDPELDHQGRFVVAGVLEVEAHQGFAVVGFHQGLLLVVAHQGLLVVDIHQGLLVVDAHQGLLVVEDHQGLLVVDAHQGLLVVEDHQGLLVVEDHQGLSDVVITGFLGVVAACPFPPPRTEEDPIAMSEQALNSS